ncbi:hypothetical protein N9105_04980 [Akkermansiaceae bacterium]|nr:hypothetical protein [Akkermansiaceae bacterium]
MSRKSRRKSSARKSSGSRFFKWLAIGGGLFVVLAIVGVVLGYRAVRSYLKSDDFRVMLEEKASDSLGGQATFQPFDWAGWSLTTNEFQFAGEEAVTNLRVSNIGASVDIGAVWDGIYRIENVSLRQVELTADLRGGDEVIQDEAVEGIEVVPSSGDAGFFDQFIPKKVEITGVDIAQITGTALTDDGEWSFDGISAALRPGAGDDIYDLSLDGGTIKTPISLVEELNLRELRGRYSGDRFYLLSSQFDILERGTLTASGEYDIDRRAWSAQGKMTGVRAEEIVSEDWKQRLMGALEVDFKLRGEPEQDAVVSGSLELNQGILTALPILDRIAAYTNAVRFRHLALSEASLDFRKEGERIEFTKIKLASEGLVRIEGRLTVEGNVIREGNFRVGITPGTLVHIPGAETTVFQRGELGLLWAPMRVSGTLDAPKEDLSDRLIEAAGLRMFEMIPATGEWVLKNTNKVVGESTKDLLAKNAFNERAVASTQKLLTALIVMRSGPLSDEVIVERSDTLVEPSKLYLKEGESYTRGELLKALIVKSGNDVALALGRDIAGSKEQFAVLMNQTAHSLGMTRSNFVNPHGLTEPGQYSTASDMAILARAVYQIPYIRQCMRVKDYVFTHSDGRTRPIKNTNRLLTRLAYCDGMKTGTTNAAGRCLISSGQLNGRAVIAIALGSNSSEIWNDSEKLLRWSLE